MNDPDEGKLATALVEAETREYREREEWGLTALAAMWPGVQRNTEELFLASFAVQEQSPGPQPLGGRSSDGADSLSQWAMYADDGKGVALVFDVIAEPETPIFEVEDKSSGLTRDDGEVEMSQHSCVARFCRVQYWRKDEARIVEWIRREFNRMPITSADALAIAQGAIERTLRPMVKSDFYAQEHECRLVAPVPTSLARDGSLVQTKPIKFTDGGKPYLEFKWARCLRLKEYWLGPRSTPSDAAAARLFLGQLGHAHVEVKNSGGAYQGRG